MSSAQSRYVLGLSYGTQEILASMYKIAVPIQDDAQVGRGRSTFDRTIHESLSGKCGILQKPFAVLSVRKQMEHPAALHRLKVGVPATVEHSSEAGPETSKWVAETTQVG